jgi:hypothetical protein
MVIVAFVLHILIYVALEVAIVRLGGRYLPSPFSEFAITIPLVVALGLLLILITLPNWSLI